MCGIAGIHFKDPNWIGEKHHELLEKFADELMLGIEPRGIDATGFVAVDVKGNIVLDKKADEASTFIKTRKRLPAFTRTALFHTRLATQGHQSNWLNNHPVFSETCFVTHNGTIRNDTELFKKEEMTRNAEVDSEVIAAIINKTGFDDVDKALSKLQGGFAIACIDPVKFPKKLILAKGDSYPLVYHENNKFLVWASTPQVIREAWEAVMPDSDLQLTTKSLNAGDVIHVEDESVVLDANAFVQPYSWKRSTTYSSGASSYSGCYSWDDEDDWDDYKDYQSRSTRNVVVKDRSKEVAEFRAEGKGKALVWEGTQRPDMSEWQLARHNGKWETCQSCKMMVAEMDMCDTMLHGHICADCRTVAYSNQGTVKTKTFVSETVRKDLEDWVELERDIYKESITSVAKDTGLSPAAIEYLLYRCPVETLNKNKTWDDLYKELLDLVDEAENDAWERYAQKWDDEQIEQMEVEVETTATEGTVFTVHRNGSMHKKSDGCDEKCEAADKDDSAADCGVEVFEAEDRDYSCHFCGGGVTWGVVHKCSEILEAAKPKSDRCMVGRCKKRAKYELGKAFQFCENHYKKCSTRKCKGRPVGTVQSDGTRRLCHVHARNQKGVVFDGDKEGLNRAARV